MAQANYWTPSIVTYLLIFGFSATLYFLVTRPVPAENKDILLILIGALAAKFGDAIAYWLGSAATSKAKDAALAKMAQQQGGGNAGTGA